MDALKLKVGNLINKSPVLPNCAVIWEEAIGMRDIGKFRAVVGAGLPAAANLAILKTGILRLYLLG